MSVVFDTMMTNFNTQLAVIKDIDEQLDPTTASKTKLLNQAVANNSDTVDAAVKTVKELFAPLTAEQIAAVHTALRKEVRTHQDTVDTYVKENTPADVTPVQLTEAEVTALNDKRTEAVNEARASRAFLISMDKDLAKTLDRVSARQKGGQRAGGPRLKGTYNFSDNGEPIDGKTLSAVRLAIKADSVQAIREAIVAQNQPLGEDIWAKELERFEFSMTTESGDHKVIARLVEPSDSGEDDVPESEDDDDDDDNSDPDDLFN